MARTSTAEERAEALLRRGTRVRAPELVKLIHEVNPTDLGLPPAVERRRYALKSRLQSLLLREFPDEIVVAPVSGQDGVVALHYRPHDRDACHAVVSELEDDARSFVRLQLDLAAERGNQSSPRAIDEREGRRRTAPVPASRSEPGDPRQLLRHGREALEAYDFESAQACFEEAFGRSGGGAPEALALLEFLVDHLAAYPGALEHEAGLSQAALRDERVRALLAFSAANVGDVTACRRFIAGAEGHHAAAAWALLARHALEDSNLSEVESCLAAARRIESALPELVALAADASRRKAEARRPEEEELERLVTVGDEEAAARKAEAILGHWPESTTARKVRSEIEARRRAREAEALRRQGEEAYSAARFDDALAAWRRAETLGAAGLETRIAEASSRVEARLREERMRAVDAALTSPASSESLSAYLALPAAERQILRAQSKLPELEWLEELRRGSAGREPDPDVLAVAALSRAASLGPGAVPAHVLALLSQHEPRLRKLEHARQILGEAQRAQGRAAMLLAEERLRAARAACAAGDLDEAIRLASDPATAVLRGEAAAVLDDARARQQRYRRLERYSAAMAIGELFGALEIVREACTDPGEAEEDWGSRRVEVAWRLREELWVDVVACPEGVDAPEYATAVAVSDDPVPCLSSDGEHLFWATAYGRELFIHRLSLSGERVDLLVSATTPEPLQYPDVLLDGTSLWVQGVSGTLLELSTDTWEVLRWLPVSALTAADEIVEEAMLVPGTELLWISTRRQGGTDETIRVFKLGQTRPMRELRGGLGVVTVPGPAGPIVFLRGLDREGRLCAPAGNVMVQVPEYVEHLVMLPGGGFIGSSGGEGDDAVRLAWLGERGEAVATATVPNACPDYPHVLVGSSAVGAAFVQFQDVDGTCRCAAFSLDRSRTLERLWTCEIPNDTIVTHDVGGVHAALRWPTGRGPSAVALGREVPVCATDRMLHRRALPALQDEYLCAAPPAESAEAKRRVSSTARTVKDQPSDAARARFVDETIEWLHDDPIELVRLAHELRSWRLTGEAGKVQAYAKSRFSAHPRVRLDEAGDLARGDDWARVREVLSGLDATFLDARGQAHVRHLRGLALYHDGRYEEATLEMAEAARAPKSECSVTSWEAWLRFMAHPTERSPEDPAALLLASLVHTDLLLAVGDCVGATRELDTGIAWRAMDVQIGARLAQAMLLKPDDTASEAVRKRLVLAAFLHRYGEPLGRFRGTLPLGPWPWSREELAAVAARAEEWLARHRGR